MGKCCKKDCYYNSQVDNRCTYNPQQPEFEDLGEVTTPDGVFHAMCCPEYKKYVEDTKPVNGPCEHEWHPITQGTWNCTKCGEPY